MYMMSIFTHECPIKQQENIITTYKSNTSDLYNCRCTSKKCIIMHCSISEVIKLNKLND